jgi:hypothetical protein
MGIESARQIRNADANTIDTQSRTKEYNDSLEMSLANLQKEKKTVVFLSLFLTGEGCT